MTTGYIKGKAATRPFTYPQRAVIPSDSEEPRRVRRVLCRGHALLFGAAHTWMFRPSGALAKCVGARAMGYTHRFGVWPLRGVCVQRLKRLNSSSPIVSESLTHPRHPDVGTGHALSNDARPKAQGWGIRHECERAFSSTTQTQFSLSLRHCITNPSPCL
jgi:hypothetical protein